MLDAILALRDDGHALTLHIPEAANERPQFLDFPRQNLPIDRTGSWLPTSIVISGNYAIVVTP